MTETKMNVVLLAHTQLSEDYCSLLSQDNEDVYDHYAEGRFNDGQAIALSAIRTCYSPGKPSEIVAKEGTKYFGNQATDGEAGTEADRLFRQIVASKHTSTLEHITFTFAIEGVSRALLAQITRHRVGFSFSVQSQRYVRFGSDDRSGGFDYVVPDSVKGKPGAEAVFQASMRDAQIDYDTLRAEGVPAEDCRAVLPNATATNLVMTANLRALLDFYGKRRTGRGGQLEIAQLAEELRKAVTEVEPWCDAFFEGA